MAKVAVIGGGSAGAAAAREADSRGADVVLYESQSCLPPPGASWLSLLADKSSAQPPETAGGSSSSPCSQGALEGTDVDVRTGEKVAAVDSQLRLTSPRGRQSFDSVIIATGHGPSPEARMQYPFRLRPADGLHVLESVSSLLHFKRKMSQYTKAVVSGSWPLVLEVASAAVDAGIRVALMMRWESMAECIEEGPLNRLEAAASLFGVTVIHSRPEYVAGVDRVEAVMTGGEVIPCDAFVVVPKLAPRVPFSVPLRLGRTGGIAVNDSMFSGVEGLFAAGRCAEMSRGRTTFGCATGSSAQTMGRVAGANAAGGWLAAKVTGCLSRRIFGTEVAFGGMSLHDAMLAGLNATVTSAQDSEVACSIVYDKGDLRVYGIQMVGKGAICHSSTMPFIISNAMGIDELAYHDGTDSIDISPIFETAKHEMRRESR
jgi:NADPH-dependent 2,4-dienoyl-CoA reductase/sulfur reductase-like enzyme